VDEVEDINQLIRELNSERPPGAAGVSSARLESWLQKLVQRSGSDLLLVAGALYAEGALGATAALLMRGSSAGVVGLVAITSLRIMRGSLRGLPAAVVALLTFVAVGPLRLPTVAVVLAMIAVSVALQWGMGAPSAVAPAAPGPAVPGEEA
jgi:hypothetical protein